MEMAQEGSRFMVEHLMMKILPENTPVQAYCQWLIVEEIPTPVSFLLHSKHALI